MPNATCTLESAEPVAVPTELITPTLTADSMAPAKPGPAL